jgi:hypothetical protein
MPSTDRKLELKAKTSVAQTVSQAVVYAKGLTNFTVVVCLAILRRILDIQSPNFGSETSYPQ